MAGSGKSLAFISTVLFMSSLFFSNNEARPLNHNVAVVNDNNYLFGELFIEAMKNSGPSSGGHGHKSTTGSEIMVGENKTGGPSSGGQGHEFIDDELLEENKRSGPSPGDGN